MSRARSMERRAPNERDEEVVTCVTFEINATHFDCVVRLSRDCALSKWAKSQTSRYGGSCGLAKTNRSGGRATALISNMAPINHHHTVCVPGRPFLRECLFFLVTCTTIPTEKELPLSLRVMPCIMICFRSGVKRTVKLNRCVLVLVERFGINERFLNK